LTPRSAIEAHSTLYDSRRCVIKFDAMQSTKPAHVYEIRPRKDKRGLDLISDALPFGGLWYLQVADAISYAKHRSRAHDAVISVYDAPGKMIEVHRHKGDFKEQ